jgi:hypothetical protein
MKYSERRCRHTITMLTDHMVFTPKHMSLGDSVKND